MIPFPRYLPDANALAVSGIPEPFPAGSLVAARQGDMLAVQSPVDGSLICAWARYDRWTQADGTALDTAEAAFAALDTACRQKRTVGSPARNYALAVADGQTVFPLSPAPTDVNTVMLLVNGTAYAPPAIAVSDLAVTWVGAFDLASTDAVRVLYF